MYLKMQRVRVLWSSLRLWRARGGGVCSFSVCTSCSKVNPQRRFPTLLPNPSTRLHVTCLISLRHSFAFRLAPSNSRSLCSHGNGQGSYRPQANKDGVISDQKPGDDAKVPFYDIIIAGGGMTGLAMACALGLEASLDPYKILLIEGGSKPEMLPDDLSDVEYSNRVCALGQSSVDLLSSIGAWSHMVNHRVQPVRSIQVWDACSDAAISFRDHRVETTRDLAFIVENSVMVDALRQQLVQQLANRVKVQYKTSCKDVMIPDQGLSHQESWVRVELTDGKVVKTRLLIGADGSNSVVRRLCNLHYVQWKYNQSAVVATLHLSEPTENVVAWQRFLPSGPIAMLPLTNELSSLVWSTSPSQAESLLVITEEQFVHEVNNAFWDDSGKNEAAATAGQVLNSLLTAINPDGSAVRQLPPSVSGISPGSRATFPLSLGHASHYVKSRIVLIGDAAHRVHPLAGQGVNLGFGDVACLRDSLVSAASMGKDLGCPSHHLEYETKRQREVLPLMAVIDGLKRLYSTDNPAVVVARSLGLQATNAMEPIKQMIISQATGR